MITCANSSNNTYTRTLLGRQQRRQKEDHETEATYRNRFQAKNSCCCQVHLLTSAAPTPTAAAATATAQAIVGVKNITIVTKASGDCCKRCRPCAEKLYKDSNQNGGSSSWTADHCGDQRNCGCNCWCRHCRRRNGQLRTNLKNHASTVFARRTNGARWRRRRWPTETTCLWFCVSHICTLQSSPPIYMFRVSRIECVRTWTHEWMTL